MLVFKSANTSSRTGLDSLVRDPLLTGANGGVRFAFDLAFGFSYGGGAPANGAAINDIAENANASFTKAASQTVAYNGGGLDFSTMNQTVTTTDEVNNILAPASVWADIYAAQQFLWCAYVRLPTASDWNTAAALLPLFASSTGGYTTEADPLTVAFQTGSWLSFRRQTAVGSQVEQRVQPAAGHLGTVCQLAYWRNAAGVGARLKGAAGSVSAATAGSTTANAANFSACQPQFGSVAPFTDYSQLAHQKSRNYRLYRGFLENLATSGRDPVAVLDADYARVIARGVFS